MERISIYKNYVIINTIHTELYDKEVEITAADIENQLVGNKHFIEGTNFISEKRLLALYKQYVPAKQKSLVEKAIERIIEEEANSVEEETLKRR